MIRQNSIFEQKIRLWNSVSMYPDFEEEALIVFFCGFSWNSAVDDGAKQDSIDFGLFGNSIMDRKSVGCSLHYYR